MYKTNINTMLLKKIDLSTADNVPGCHNSFFKNPSSQQFIEIESCKSFSKSNEKKLKIISDRRSLQKSSQFLQQKRKIKPLNLKVAYAKQEQRAKKMLCSIKGFKQKINKITYESNMSSNLKIKTLNTDISQNIENSTKKLNDQSNQSSQFYVFLNNKEIITNQTLDPFPTLGNSLVVHESCFNPDSLLQSNQVTVPSNQISFQNSPRIQINDQPQNNFLTPYKIKIKEQEPSTRVSFRKQKICLDNARKVETFETLKTQNEICSSVAEQNEYKKFFDNIAFPDYFSSKQYRRASQEKQVKTNKSFKYQANPVKLY